MAIIDHPCWYPLRVTYSRELKVRDILRNEGYECFVPMTVKDIVADGRKSRTYVPAVNNLCFVRAERQSLDEVLESRGMRQFTSYIWDRPTREPAFKSWRNSAAFPWNPSQPLGTITTIWKCCKRRGSPPSPKTARRKSKNWLM